MAIRTVGVVASRTAIFAKVFCVPGISIGIARAIVKAHGLVAIGKICTQMYAHDEKQRGSPCVHNPGLALGEDHSHGMVRVGMSPRVLRERPGAQSRKIRDTCSLLRYRTCVGNRRPAAPTALVSSAAFWPAAQRRFGAFPCYSSTLMSKTSKSNKLQL